MNQPHTHTLKVPGATVHYDVCGSGPVLLGIPGGDLRPARVVAQPVRRRTPGHDGSDLRRRRPATAGSSRNRTGIRTWQQRRRLVGLELVREHPEQVRVLVAHEPPCTRLLDDADEHLAFDREVYDTYRAEGVGPAMGKFMAAAGLDQGEPPPADSTPEMDEAMARMGKMEFFLAHMWLPLTEYAPDTSQLGSLPITVAVGEASEGQLAHRAARALAAQRGQEPTVFPGDYGWGGNAEAFADRLDEVLSRY